jgi:hypothetical protein
MDTGLDPIVNVFNPEVSAAERVKTSKLSSCMGTLMISLSPPFSQPHCQGCGHVRFQQLFKRSTTRNVNEYKFSHDNQKDRPDEKSSW